MLLLLLLPSVVISQRTSAAAAPSSLHPAALLNPRSCLCCRAVAHQNRSPMHKVSKFRLGNTRNYYVSTLALLHKKAEVRAADPEKKLWTLPPSLTPPAYASSRRDAKK